MEYRLTLKAWDTRDMARDRSIIINTMDKYIKSHGLDAVEARMSVMCLELAEKLGYIFEQEENELIFIQRGLQ